MLHEYADTHCGRTRSKILQAIKFLRLTATFSSHPDAGVMRPYLTPCALRKQKWGCNGSEMLRLLDQVRAGRIRSKGSAMPTQTLS